MPNARDADCQGKPAAALIHWEMTYEEVRASGRYTCRSDHAARPNPICRNGSFHAITSRNRAAIDCPACLERLGAP